MKGERVNYSSCICVVSYCYDRLSGGRVGGGDWYACGTKSRVVSRMSEDAGALHECEVKALMTPDHTAFRVRSFG